MNVQSQLSICENYPNFLRPAHMLTRHTLFDYRRQYAPLNSILAPTALRDDVADLFREAFQQAAQRNAASSDLGTSTPDHRKRSPAENLNLAGACAIVSPSKRVCRDIRDASMERQRTAAIPGFVDPRGCLFHKFISS